MGNEIRVQALLEVNKGLWKSPRQGQVKQKFDQTVSGGGIPGLVIALTGGTVVDLSDLVDFGWLRMQNTDDTNFVQWGTDVSNLIGEMRPDEPALFRLRDGTSLFLRADTAECKVHVTAFNS